MTHMEIWITESKPVFPVSEIYLTAEQALVLVVVEQHGVRVCAVVQLQVQVR